MSIFAKKNWKIEKKSHTLSTKMLCNPQMGFYHIYRFMLHRACDLNAATFPDVVGESIVLLEFDLSYYKDSALDMMALNTLDSIISFFEQQEKDIIVRFSYDYEGRAYEKEPQTKEILFDHIQTVCPVLCEHKDSIFMMQGFFIGNWGEMHGSRFLTESLIIRLHEMLRELLPTDMWVAVRRPSYMRLLSYETNDKHLCLFNDAILSSETDMGTYGQSGFMEDPMSRKEELQYQNKITHRIYNGGEVVSVQSRAEAYLEEPEEVLSTFSQMHINYLNRDYDTNVYRKWSEEIYPLKDEFKGMDLFSVVSAKMGYRFILKNAEMLEGDEFLLTFENHGFANALFDIDGVISIGGFEVPFPVRHCSIACGKATPFKIELPKMDKGKYDLSLSFFKAGTLRPVYFASAGYEEEAKLPLGKIIKK